MKIGYKGLTADMEATRAFGAKKETYQIGQIYSKENVQNPKICTSEGYHYCNDLENVFTYYPRNGRNRFFKIEILGNYTDSNDFNEEKSITTSFRILEELDSNFFRQWDASANERKAALELKKMERNMNLDTVRMIQTKYPTFFVGGSIGLFLHGVRLERWKGSESDIDMISPYFILPEFDTEEGVDTEHYDAKASGNDFDETVLIQTKHGTVKMDYKIDPHQRYEHVEYNGFKYKVSPLLTIVNAKMKYAMNGQRKHMADIKEMMFPRKNIG